MNKHLNKLNLEVSELDTQVETFSHFMRFYLQHPSSFWKGGVTFVGLDLLYEIIHLVFKVNSDYGDLLLSALFFSHSQFADGVYLVLLMGLLEGYFVPLYNFFLTPENFEQKVWLCHRGGRHGYGFRPDPGAAPFSRPLPRSGDARHVKALLVSQASVPPRADG